MWTRAELREMLDLVEGKVHIPRNSYHERQPPGEGAGREELGKHREEGSWKRGSSTFKNIKIHGPSSSTHTQSEGKKMCPGPLSSKGRQTAQALGLWFLQIPKKAWLCHHPLDNLHRELLKGRQLFSAPVFKDCNSLFTHRYG